MPSSELLWDILVRRASSFKGLPDWARKKMCFDKTSYSHSRFYETRTTIYKRSLPRRIGTPRATHLCSRSGIAAISDTIHLKLGTLASC